MDADALYFALTEKEPEDCTRQEMKADWEHLRSKDCTDSFFADFPQKYCRKHEKNYKRGPGLFKEEFRCTEMQWSCSMFYSRHGVTTDKNEISR